MIKQLKRFVPGLRVEFYMRASCPAWRSAALIFLLASFLAACAGNEPAMNTPSLDTTQAYQTVESRLTQSAGQTPTITNTATPTISPTETPQAGQNPGPQVSPPAPTSQPAAICDKAAPGLPMIDVNIEDGTEMEPGQRFTKIWRLTNAGICAWNREYQAIWFFGTKMGDVVAVPLVKNVAPGESIEIEVEMVAPQAPGLYRSDWKLMNDQGETFGIGPSGNSTFWVQIQVVQPPTGTPAPTTTPTETLQSTGSPDETTTPPPVAEISLSARLTLALDDTLDLNTGEINPQIGMDISYQPDDLGNHWITPINGTILGVYGNDDPNRDICMLATMSSAPIAVGSIPTGTVFCYRTDTGLPGALRLIAYTESDSSIEIDIITWELPE